MTIILKNHVKDGVLTVSLCDSNLLGKVFEEGQLYLDLTTSYYAGSEADENEINDKLIKARSATIIGKESVKVAQKIFPESSINYVEGIPFMNIMKF